MIFRRTYPRIRNEGGLWDESKDLYHILGGKPNESRFEWRFPSGASIQFRHLEHEKNLQDWHGAQVAFLGFDELTEFSERMFLYLQSRNRSTSGIRPYTRLTCNPDAESWVARFIDWWIDDDGYPDPQKSGVIRFFVRIDEVLHWFDTRQQAVQASIDAGISPKVAKALPKSFTFIPARLEDNPTLEEKDPGYRANLMAQTHVDRLRLLGGNWKVKPNVGEMFPRSGWRTAPAAPVDLILSRGWDKAGTEKGTGARTAGVLVGYQVATMRWFIVHGTAERLGDIERDNHVKSIAVRDDTLFRQVSIIIEQEPGSGGKQSALHSVRMLRGHHVSITTVTGEKASRWRPLASQVQAGNVTLIDDGTWDVEDFITELDNLSGDKEKDKTRLKDYADAASLAFNYIANMTSNDLPDELLCSGDDENPDEERTVVKEEDYDSLPPAIADILRTMKGSTRYDHDEPNDDMWGL